MVGSSAISGMLAGMVALMKEYRSLGVKKLFHFDSTIAVCVRYEVGGDARGLTRQHPGTLATIYSDGTPRCRSKYSMILPNR